MPYRLVADGASGVAFQFNEGKQIRFDHYLGDRVSSIGSAPIGTARLHSAPGGHVFLTRGVCQADSHLIGVSFDSTGPRDSHEDSTNPADNVPCPLRGPISIG